MNLYFRNTGNNWNAAINWSTTDGGPGDGRIPTINDSVFFTANSGPSCVITTSAVCQSFNGSIKILFRSLSAGIKEMLTVTGEGNVGYVDFTDIDASGGRPLYTFNGVVTNCINIFTMTDIVAPPDRTVAASFII